MLLLVVGFLTTRQYCGCFFKTMMRLEKDPEKIKTGERQCEISGLGGPGCTNFFNLFYS